MSKLCRQAHGIPDGMDCLPVPERACLPDLGDAMPNNRPVKPDQCPVGTCGIKLPGNNFYCLVNVTIVND
jgi:hypothetical protein